MIKDILTRAGLIEGETFKETRFLKPPRTSYAVYMDSFLSRGADNINLIKEHEYTIEVYSYYPDLAIESNIESILDSMGIEYEKQDRYWLQDEQLYQIIYTFNYIEK